MQIVHSFACLFLCACAFACAFAFAWCRSSQLFESCACPPPTSPPPTSHHGRSPLPAALHMKKCTLPNFMCVNDLGFKKNSGMFVEDFLEGLATCGHGIALEHHVSRTRAHVGKHVPPQPGSACASGSSTPSIFAHVFLICCSGPKAAGGLHVYCFDFCFGLFGDSLGKGVEPKRMSACHDMM